MGTLAHNFFFRFRPPAGWRRELQLFAIHPFSLVFVPRFRSLRTSLRTLKLVFLLSADLVKSSKLECWVATCGK